LVGVEGGGGGGRSVGKPGMPVGGVVKVCARRGGGARVCVEELGGRGGMLASQKAREPEHPGLNEKRGPPGSREGRKRLRGGEGKDARPPVWIAREWGPRPRSGVCSPLETVIEWGKFSSVFGGCFGPKKGWEVCEKLTP